MRNNVKQNINDDYDDWSCCCYDDGTSCWIYGNNCCGDGRGKTGGGTIGCHSRGVRERPRRRDPCHLYADHHKTAYISKGGYFFGIKVSKHAIIGLKRSPFGRTHNVLECWTGESTDKGFALGLSFFVGGGCEGETKGQLRESVFAAMVVVRVQGSVKIQNDFGCLAHGGHVVSVQDA